MEVSDTARTVKTEDKLLVSTQNETAKQELATSAQNATETRTLLDSAEPDSGSITISANSFDDLLTKLIKAFKEKMEKNPDLPNSAEPKKETKANSKPKNSKQIKFPAYITAKEVEDGLKTGELIKGIIRINPKNNRKAYVSNENPLQEDYLLEPAEDRNRALEGDIVIIKLKPKEEWAKNKKTAVVVHIWERIHSRTTVGSLKRFPDNNKQFGMLIPRDYRIPKIRIPVTDCPTSFHEQHYKYKNVLYKAKITTWNDTRYAVGNIVEKIGIAGDLEAETTALIIESDLDVAPFSNELLQNLPLADTIDPETAHDLDDAVSCKELENGNLEVGVHISDVTHYLKEGTLLDKSACKKATTTYLVNKAFHMLPQELCLRCSLVPGSDKLTFSVIWEMTKTGKIVRHRFVRTVINSCAQLSYEHAQTIIDNPNYVFKEGEFPQIFGGFAYKDLSKSINYLHKIAMNLRAQRFEGGALRINQTKLTFRLDKESGEPVEYTVYEYKETHKLVEEFMLLANISVAHKIVDAFPHLAFLRCHNPANQRLLTHWQKTLKIYGIDIDISSSKALQSSIWKIKSSRSFGNARMAALKHLIIKSMVRARYVCAANTDSEEDFYHYALHVPMYTHFTSPIRRYPDVTVHRLLSASLGYTKKHIWKVKYLTTVANNCNKKKDSAKRAQEYSSDLYLAHYIEQHQPFIQEAVVVDVKKNSFDILVVGIGTVIRIYANALGDDVQYVQSEPKNKMQKQFLLTLPKTSEFPEQKYMIQLFSVLKVSLFRKFKTRKLEAKLLREVTG